MRTVLPSGVVGRFARRLRTDERGFVLPMVAISMVAFFGLGGLAIDLGRLYNENTELQSYADAAALAAAAELDGNGGAITRATNAANNLIADTQSFGTGAPALTIDSLTFYSAIPNDDAGPIPTEGPIPGGAVTTSNSNARFVQVAVRQETLNLFFMPVLQAFGIASPNQATTQAWATAGFTRVICDITPLMICNPMENAGGGGGFDIQQWIGRQIRLKMQAAGSQWAPGDFGWLDAAIDPEGPCPVNQGADSQRCAMAAVEGVTQCFGQNGVDVRPGQLGASGESGVNVRFDIFSGSFNGSKNDPNFAAAPNVTKGLTPQGGAACPNWNQATLSANTVALPRDPCFWNGSCGGGGRFGDGVTAAQLDTYWQTNHGTARPATPDYDGNGAITRYDVYADEIATNTMVTNPPKAENGAPSCNAPGAGSPANTPERRVVLAAVLNCIENGVQGNASGVPVIELLRLFLTEPAGDPAGLGNLPPPNDHDVNDLWVEVLDRVQANADDGVLHEFPVLYR